MRNKIMTLARAQALREQARSQGKKVAFTNGCFDLLHAGHVDYLELARAQADLLIVGLNSDASLRRLKGEGRPLNAELDRAAVLAGLACVDAVVIFGEDTPYELIAALAPDVLVKGADWAEGQIVGADLVTAHGGRVFRAPLTAGRSTSALIERIARSRR
jgi:rfaE bifunctional protein nucleotidyltransferase chain/domain